MSKLVYILGGGIVKDGDNWRTTVLQKQATISVYLVTDCA